MLKDPRLLWAALVALSIWNCSLQSDVWRAQERADGLSTWLRAAEDRRLKERTDEIDRLDR